MARWSEEWDRERRDDGGREGRRARDWRGEWRDEWREDDRGGDWRVGDWRAGERGEWHGGAREWEGRDRPLSIRYGPGPGRDPTFGAGGMYGGVGGTYGGSSHVGSGLPGGYRGTFRGHGRRRDDEWQGARGDESGWRGGDRGFDERESAFTRGLRRYGRGPKGYRRSDERIQDDVSERIARSGIDASDVEVKVEKGEVTLTGFVEDREDKRALEDLADDVFGVDEVHNLVRLRRGPRPESQTFAPAERDAPQRH